MMDLCTFLGALWLFAAVVCAAVYAVLRLSPALLAWARGAVRGWLR